MIMGLLAFVINLDKCLVNTMKEKVERDGGYCRP